MDKLSDRLITNLALLPSGVQHLIVGYSGGADSHVLLHLLATQRTRWQRPGSMLTAIYVDHGWHAASSAWGAHCAQVCHELHVPFRILTVDARPAPGESPEAAARRARYTALAAEIAPHTALVTAHHQDDQAETLLLQLLRGAGPHGLAAMPLLSRLGQGWLWRPLLPVERAELRAYAQEHRLRWIEDTSNEDIRFNRNYLRHRVLPLLRARWPAVSRTLARAARQCGEAALALDEQAAADLMTVATSRRDALWIPALQVLSERRQRHLMRYWIRQLGLPVPDTRQLHQILHEVLTAAIDRTPCCHWPGGEIRRYRDRLYAMSPLPPQPPRALFIWRADEVGNWPPLVIPGAGKLSMQKTLTAGLSLDTLSTGILHVHFRRGGERFRPVGRRHRQEVKKLLQRAGIPPWERDRLPLIRLVHNGTHSPSAIPGRNHLPSPPEEGALLAVVGLGISADWLAKPGTGGWEPIWECESGPWSWEPVWEQSKETV